MRVSRSKPVREDKMKRFLMAIILIVLTATSIGGCSRRKSSQPSAPPPTADEDKKEDGKTTPTTEGSTPSSSSSGSDTSSTTGSSEEAAAACNGPYRVYENRSCVYKGPRDENGYPIGPTVAGPSGAPPVPCDKGDCSPPSKRTETDEDRKYSLPAMTTETR